jgi:hypothetical protein
MASDINNIIKPSALNSLKENMLPVACKVYMGNNTYDEIELDNLYPFDTLDTIKQTIFSKYDGSMDYYPRFMFVGIPNESINDVKEDNAIKFTPLDYLWYPSDTKSAKNTYKLNHPTLFIRDLRFIERDSTIRTLNYEVRGRTTIEHALLKPNSGMVPTLYVFTLKSLLIDYKNNTVRPPDWNSKFAAYFPDVKNVGPEPFMYNEDDDEFGQKIMQFIAFIKNQQTQF